jgi:hypothetical protein
VQINANVMLKHGLSSSPARCMRWWKSHATG